MEAVAQPNSLVNQANGLASTENANVMPAICTIVRPSVPSPFRMSCGAQTSEI